MAQVAPTDATVLITGETGCGKELVPRDPSSRLARSGPLHRGQLRRVPEGLLESELFGHERGAFTGARAPRGPFEQAHGARSSSTRSATCRCGLQAKLLRVLQEGEIRAWGQARPSGRRARDRRDEPDLGDHERRGASATTSTTA